MDPDEDSTSPGRSGRSRGPGWRRLGEEPDYRFTLANERTFLAWIRTALAVLAAGVLLEQFAAKLHQLARFATDSLRYADHLIDRGVMFDEWRGGPFDRPRNERFGHRPPQGA